MTSYLGGAGLIPIDHGDELGFGQLMIDACVMAAHPASAEDGHANAPCTGLPAFLGGFLLRPRSHKRTSSSPIVSGSGGPG